MPYDDLPRAELIALLEQHLARARVLDHVLADLRLHQEELTAQQEHLMDAQRRLESAGARYADLFESAPVGYATLDAVGHVTAANRTLARLVARRPSTLVGMPLSQFVHVDDRPVLREHFRQLRAGAGSAGAHVRLCAAHDGFVPVDIVTCPTPARGDIDDVYRTTVIDVADRVRAESERARLAALERMARHDSEAKTSFLAAVSHELRTPLGPLLYAIEALEEADDPHATRTMLAMIRRNVEHQARLVDDLLDVVSLGRGELRIEHQPVDIHVVLHELLDDAAGQAAAKAITLESQLRAEHPRVLGDVARLRQVFSNLFANAIRHTPSGGRISVSSATPAAARLAITITDTGDGIDPGDLQRLFEPFEQTQRTPGRLGLGLAIARGIVERHNGTIRAESGGIGTGASFMLELPTMRTPE